MDNLILIGQAYQIFLLVFMSIYMIQHFIFTYSRLYGEQRNYYHDILDTEMPTVSVVIPMHNEELVAENVLERLVLSDYPKEKMEIIPINDHSTDRTKDIIDTFARKHPGVKPFHRLKEDEKRGKAEGLNDVMKFTKGDIIVVFDADYQPAKEAIKSLVMGFKDPQVGAVMGRVLVQNSDSNLLTLLLDMERSAGYQISQQARYNMDLIPQYGGTVGAYRKSVVRQMGGFDPKVLAEDTDLTYKMYLNGWKIAYANKTECYEQMPETWAARARQVRRWSRGHNEVLFHHLPSIFTSKYFTLREKWDGLLLLFVYMMPILLMVGIADSIFLFFMDAISIVTSMSALLLIMAINAFGNFAPFFQITIANYLDGRTESLKLTPMFAFNFVLYIFYTSRGFIDALIDLATRRDVDWDKTKRHQRKNNAK